MQRINAWRDADPILHDGIIAHCMPTSKHLRYPITIYIYYVFTNIKNKNFLQNKIKIKEHTGR